MTRSASTVFAIAKIAACCQRPRNFSIAGIAAVVPPRRSTTTTSGGVLCAVCSSIGRTDTAPDRRRRAMSITKSWSSLTISPLSCAIAFLPLVDPDRCDLPRGSLRELSLIGCFRRPQPFGCGVDLLLTLLEQRRLALRLLLLFGLFLLGLFCGQLVGLGLFLRR